MDIKPRAICGRPVRPVELFVTAGQASNHAGARALIGSLPSVKWRPGSCGHDAGRLREALQDKGMRACIPGRKQRKIPFNHGKRRDRIEIMSGRLRDRRRAATRCGSCPRVFLQAIALAATVTFWA